MFIAILVFIVSFMLLPLLAFAGKRKYKTTGKYDPFIWWGAFCLASLTTSVYLAASTPKGWISLLICAAVIVLSVIVLNRFSD